MFTRIWLTAGFFALVIPTIAVAAPDPYALARRLDQILAQYHQGNRIQPADLVDDAAFARRSSLDIIGRIPTADEANAFLTDSSADKRRKLIAKLLASPGYADNSANFWRALLLPETATNADMRFLQPGFENWLKAVFRENTPYNKWVFELIAAPLGNNQERLESPDDARANPLAFYTAKDGKPENLAAAVAKTFLGVQIECAQCHDHPTAKWSREHFWGMAAFFGGIERKGDGAFNPMMREIIDRRELTIPGTERVVQATFLDEKEPEWKFRTSARVTLAEWVTSAHNKWFAPALVNRVWAHLVGYGIVDPVDDSNEKNQPSHPALLDELAGAFIGSGYDLRFLITAITATDAYQRDSALTHPSQNDPRAFARMPVKGLTGEQLFDCLVTATGYREPEPKKADGIVAAALANGSAARAVFLDKFALPGRKVDPQTSILQALSLMNGRFVADATSVSNSVALRAIATKPNLTAAERVEALFLTTLSRKPTVQQQQRALRHIEGAGPDKLQAALSDVMWALLNSAEFRLNH